MNSYRSVKLKLPRLHEGNTSGASSSDTFSRYQLSFVALPSLSSSVVGRTSLSRNSDVTHTLQRPVPLPTSLASLSGSGNYLNESDVAGAADEIQSTSSKNSSTSNVAAMTSGGKSSRLSEPRDGDGLLFRPFFPPEASKNEDVLSDVGVNAKCSSISAKITPQSSKPTSEGADPEQANKAEIFKCKFCDRTFSYHCHLRVHERVHTGEKPFPCKFCSTQFSQLGSLTVHMRIHTGEKPYICGICSKRFRHINSLRRHQRQVHSNGTEGHLSDTTNEDKNDGFKQLVQYRKTKPKYLPPIPFQHFHDGLSHDKNHNRTPFFYVDFPNSNGGIRSGVIWKSSVPSLTSSSFLSSNAVSVSSYCSDVASYSRAMALKHANFSCSPKQHLPEDQRKINLQLKSEGQTKLKKPDDQKPAKESKSIFTSIKRLLNTDKSKLDSKASKISCKSGLPSRNDDKRSKRSSSDEGFSGSDAEESKTTAKGFKNGEESKGHSSSNNCPHGMAVLSAKDLRKWSNDSGFLSCV
ncbi:uncharacterized protein LOC143468184 [Clavelina lepadiformis]|uniref:uncharacterized protein LOC143468184 n=1 Tax=Clavelina lepadiformis TaxID=159417 RepID=UPI0040434617